MIAALLIVFVVTLVIGVPIAGCMSLAALASMIKGDIVPTLIIQRMFTGTDSFPMMAIPFFMLSGVIMEKGGVSRRLVGVVSLIFERLPGGLAIITIVASCFFGAISGSAPATVAAIGGICVPIMLKEGYDDRFALSTAATSGCLGSIIPPSIVMVTYCVACNLSIGDMFIAGIGPGIMLTVGFCIYAFIYSKRNGLYAKTRVERTKTEIRNILIGGLPALFMPVIILGGIYGGIFTATEAGCVAALYGIVIALFVYRELKLKDLPDIIRNTVNNTTILMVVMADAAAFGQNLTRLQIPTMASTYIMSFAKNKYVFLLLVNVLLLIVGCFMETASAILILAPILYPAAAAFGCDLLHFGLIMCLNLVLGLITPPVGMNLVVAASISKSKMDRVLGRPLLWYCIIGFGLLILFTYIPDLALITYHMFAK